MCFLSTTFPNAPAHPPPPPPILFDQSLTFRFLSLPELFTVIRFNEAAIEERFYHVNSETHILSKNSTPDLSTFTTRRNFSEVIFSLEFTD